MAELLSILSRTTEYFTHLFYLTKFYTFYLMIYFFSFDECDNWYIFKFIKWGNNI